MWCEVSSYYDSISFLSYHFLRFLSSPASEIKNAIREGMHFLNFDLRPERKNNAHDEECQKLVCVI